MASRCPHPGMKRGLGLLLGNAQRCSVECNAYMPLLFGLWVFGRIPALLSVLKSLGVMKRVAPKFSTCSACGKVHSL